jgi:hypothetical protein
MADDETWGLPFDFASIMNYSPTDNTVRGVGGSQTLAFRMKHHNQQCWASNFFGFIRLNEINR